MSENKSFDELLLPVRNDIDRIDKELLKLFTERMQCAEQTAPTPSRRVSAMNFAAAAVLE